MLALRGLPALKGLELQGVHPKLSLAPLAHLKRLEKLEIYNAFCETEEYVFDITPLGELVSLQDLTLMRKIRRFRTYLIWSDPTLI